MFNTISLTIFEGFKIASHRNVLKGIDSVQDTVPLVKRSIEIIGAIQRDFFKTDKRMVGGKIHDLAIDKHGIFYSQSGDK